MLPRHSLSSEGKKCVVLHVQSLNRVRTLCDPADYSTPGSSVLYSLSEFAEIHAHGVDDAI